MELARIRVAYDGERMTVDWEIPASAHTVGLAAVRRSAFAGTGDWMGHPDGAEAVGQLLTAAAHRLRREFEGAWSDPYPVLF